MHHPKYLGRRAVVRAMAAVTLAAGVGVALPAAPAMAAASPLPVDVTYASTPQIDPSGLFMLSRGLDGSVLFARGNPSVNGFDDFFSIGGQIIGDPRGVVVNEGVQVFARSTNNTPITSLVISRSFPSAWLEIPGLTISGEVTAIKIPPRGSRPPMIRLFARSLEDGGVYTNLIVGETPQGWGPLGIYTTSEISVAVIPPAVFDIDLRLVVRGFDNRLYSSIFNNTFGPVTNWEPLGVMQVNGNPVLANEGSTFDYRGNEVFVRGPGGAIFTWNFDAPGWVSLGGVLQGDPAVSIASDGGLHLHLWGTNQRIYLNRRPPGGRFGGDINLGGRATSNLAASGGGAINGRTVVDQFITRSLENRMHSRIQVNLVGGFTGFFYFGGPLHG